MLPIRWLDDALTEAEDTARYYGEIDLELGEDWWDKLGAQLKHADNFHGAGKRVARVEGAEVRRYLGF